jgi:hypothetical protein
LQAVNKRRVFYISGFDPRGVYEYHKLFADEVSKQAAWSNFSIKVGPRRRESSLSSIWQVKRDVNDINVHTTFEFMHWDDIARRHWHPGLASLYRMACTVYGVPFRSPAFLMSVLRLSNKWNIVAGFAPALVLLGLPPLGLAAGWTLGAALQATPGSQAWWPALAGGAGFAAALWLTRWLHESAGLGWLLRSFDFLFKYSWGKVSELDARIDHFAGHLARYIGQCDDDEVLIIGHSSGANVAVSVLARALAAYPALFSGRTSFGFLTLGGTIPVQGVIPWMGSFRNELALLAQSGDLTWIDVTAPQDVLSFALVNPVIASGVVLEQPPRQPKAISGLFKEKLSSNTYPTASWNIFRMHFQYLMASEHARNDDYLAATTDNLRFVDRFSEKV